MNTTTNQTTAVSCTPKRVILASAYRHERALKIIRKIGRFDDDEMLAHRHIRRISSAEETLDD